MSAIPEFSGPILVTGGAGFIGGNFVMEALEKGYEIITLDALTYAANPLTLKEIDKNSGHQFVHGSITDELLVTQSLAKYQPHAIINFAAESHVDRSIDSAAPFWSTNVGGTCTLLECALRYWRQLAGEKAASFRYLQISTDEVFGSVESGSVTETAPYRPNSPYAASKAASDHFVRAYHKTHGLPTLLTHSVNNYGPYHFPEKLIPLTILSALEERPLPVYGDGQNVREWIYVRDNCDAIMGLLGKARPGETYNIGSGDERTNLSVVETICSILDNRAPRSNSQPYAQLVEFVADRPGHDFRYSLDSGKIRNETGWCPRTSFESGLTQTIEWYLENEPWWHDIWEGRYGGERLGLKQKAAR